MHVDIAMRFHAERRWQHLSESD